MSIKIFLCKEEKVDLTNTWNKHVVLFASRHPPPVTRFPLVPAFFDTRDTLHIYSVLCPLHMINHSAWVCTSINQTWAYPSKILYLLWYLLYFYKYLHKKKCENMCSTVPAGYPGAPSPAETTFSCLFGEVVGIAWFQLSIFNTKRAGHVGMKS